MILCIDMNSRAMVCLMTRCRGKGLVSNRVTEQSCQKSVARFNHLEAQLPTYWVPVPGSLYKLILSITQEPTIWVPGLLGIITWSRDNIPRRIAV